MSFFYNLNKALDAIREKPELKHGQLNERDMSRAAKGYEKYGKEGMEALAKAGREGKDLDKVRAKYDKYDESVDEGMGDAVKKIGSAAKKLGQKAITTLGHGDDAEMLRDLQRKMGVPQTGMKPGDEPNPKIVKEKMSPAKAKSFAALAEPKDKITFADKIAGAKKEVDEMLGDVAAEAMKKAIGGRGEEMDEAGYSAKAARAGKDIGKPGKNFAKIAKGAAARYGSEESGKKVAGAVLNKLRHKGGAEEMEEGWDDMLKDVERRRSATKKGEVTHGAKHDITDTGTGRRVQRRTDPNTGYSVGADADDKPADGEKRGRGRPKKTDKAPERVTAKATKHKGGRKVKEEDMNEGSDEGIDMVKLAKVIQSCKTMDQLEAARKMAQNFLRKHQTDDLAFYGSDMKRKMAAVSDINRKKAELQGGQELEEKAVSKKQQKFMGMVHATQKGEKAPSKEVAKVAKTMKKSDAKDFASTKQKGLPEKAPKKKEKTEEAGGTKTPTASSGFSFGQGIYDSMNFELEQMISESMSINVSSDSEGHKNITVTASDEDAIKLAGLLKSAGLGGDNEGYGGTGYKSACGCDAGADCSCGDEELDENSPDWPTDTVQAQDNLEYSGGLNKPKSTGQTTVPVIASQEERQGTYAEAEQDAIKRMMEMAGIKEAKAKPDFLDMDKDGDKKEPMKKALKDKDADKVEESIFALTNQWKAYKG